MIWNSMAERRMCLRMILLRGLQGYGTEHHLHLPLPALPSLYLFGFSLLPIAYHPTYHLMTEEKTIGAELIKKYIMARAVFLQLERVKILNKIICVHYEATVPGDHDAFRTQESCPD